MKRRFSQRCIHSLQLPTMKVVYFCNHLKILIEWNYYFFGKKSSIYLEPCSFVVWDFMCLRILWSGGILWLNLNVSLLRTRLWVCAVLSLEFWLKVDWSGDKRWAIISAYDVIEVRIWCAFYSELQVIAGAKMRPNIRLDLLLLYIVSNVILKHT